MRRPVGAALAVAVVGLGLVVLAVATGWLGPDVDRGAEFCEVSGHAVRQPVNTASNLGFVVAGLLVAARAARPGGLGPGTLSRRPGLAILYACLVVLLGPASMAMHATESAAGGTLDMASMYLVAAFATAYAAMRLLHRGVALFGAVFAAVLAGCAVVEVAGGGLPVVEHAGNLAFGAFLVVALATETLVARRADLQVDGGWTLAAAGSLLVAFAVWNTAKTGGVLCFPTSLYQGHAVWHLLCAVAAWCLFRYYLSERPVPVDQPVS